MSFLKGVFNKLVLNYGWWLNRKDPDNRNVFEGGFMGRDNISVYDRSRPLAPGYSLRQADASGWVALCALNLTVMALELAREDRIYVGSTRKWPSSFTAISLPAPVPAGQSITLAGAADLIARWLLDLLRRNDRGKRAVFTDESPFQHDPHWKDLLLFHEYFHGESGRGLGASHQTGWTALAAPLLTRAYDRTAPRAGGDDESVRR
jgi:hypothetical protein